MKLSKKKIEEVRARHKDYWLGRISSDLFDILDTIEALHVEIDYLADQYQSQGRIAEAQAVRGLGE